ncbi:MAG: FAD-dependent oxidoreductase [Victivallales bacterium]|nr:FAD-dependent oxidoreductase [Victivallales bacterium]
MMHIDYDVTVVGAGTSGVISAIQAARAGAKTLLIEKTGQPGGTATSGGVDFPGLFHAWGRQVIAGIGWELVTRTVAEAGGVLPDFSKWETYRHWQLQIPVNAPLYTCILDEALRQTHVSVSYHTMVATVKEDADNVRLTLCGREGLSTVNTTVLIDASGDANAVELAGYKLRRNSEIQPCTPMIRVGGYDPATLDEKAIEAVFHKAMATGRLTRLDTGMSGSIITFLRNHGSNCIHVRAEEDPASSSGRSRMEQDARAAVLRLYRFLRSCSGLSELQLEYIAPECGILEGATIAG